MLMSHTQLKELLLKQLHSLNETHTTATDAAQTVELDQSKVGRLSRMDALQQQAMSQEQIRRRALQTRRIEAALKRIENDDYGFCLACDQEINPKRLEVDPATPYCFRCADQQQ
jgi:DnaK suppressor protein